MWQQHEIKNMRDFRSLLHFHCRGQFAQKLTGTPTGPACAATTMAVGVAGVWRA
jgi:hypothetical protein